MCGIAGKISLTEKIDKDLLKRMISTLKHRGPNDTGLYLDDSNAPFLGLSHARLSIIDLETGHQPMSNEDGTLWVVNNGEIYNFKELRDNLIKKGHLFKTKSDTEVLLHLYEENDVDMLSELRGSFSFALWDKKNKRLFAARDRIGKKPFHYYYTEKEFLFASEIKAILEDPLVPKKVDLSSIDFYLSYGYTPLNGSAFLGIKKLPPAHYLIYDSRGLKIKRYWELRYTKPRTTFDIRETEEHLLDILKESVKLRLVSDVPLGVFLSGGIDSSSVLALINSFGAPKVKTYSIGFDYEDYSELKYARKIAKLFGTDHKEFTVTCDAASMLEKLVWHYNEPYADSSSLPTYYVARYTSEHVKVALNGDGGDESFAGYDRYRAIQLSTLYDKLSDPILGLGEGVLSRAEVLFGGRKRHLLSRRADFLSGLRKYKTPSKRYEYWMRFFNDEEKDTLYAASLKSAIEGSLPISFIEDTMEKSKEIKDLRERAMKTDIETNLPGDLLVKMDIATMANSLEARSPFLDHKLMEFAAGLPIDIKLKQGVTKYILRRIMSRYLPRDVLSRKKMGFGVPVGEWFRNKLSNYLKEVLLDRRALKRGYFNRDKVERLINEHITGKRDNKNRLWALLNLELWHRIFIDR